jgi:hypothetical protein
MRTLSQLVPPQVVFGLLSLTALGLSSPGYASSVTYETGDGAMSFEFGDDVARMGASEDNYSLLSEDDRFMVSRTEEGWQVVEISSMMTAVVSFASQCADQMPGASEAGELESTGRTERVAGIKGEVYRYYDEDDKTDVEVVLTKNRDVVKVTKDMMATFASLFGDAETWTQSERAFEGKGLLLSRSEDGEFRLVSVSDKSVAKSRFELPAEPMKMGFEFRQPVWLG